MAIRRVEGVGGRPTTTTGTRFPHGNFTTATEIEEMDEIFGGNFTRDITTRDWDSGRRPVTQHSVATGGMTSMEDRDGRYC